MVAAGVVVGASVSATDTQFEDGRQRNHTTKETTANKFVKLEVRYVRMYAYDYTNAH